MIIRLIIYLVLIYIAVKLIRRILAPLQVKTADETEEMVKDPECGTYIPKKDALVKKIKGEKWPFCSDECYKKYKEKLR
jgi:YHS domain-containing protein